MKNLLTNQKDGEENRKSFNQLNSITTTRFRREGDAQREWMKSRITSRDPKNRGMMEKCSIERTSLIEKSWVKSRGEIMC